MMEKYKCLLLKEWIKTRYPLLLSVVISIAILLHLVISVYSSFKSMGGVAFFSDMIVSRPVYFASFKYIPLVVSIILALSQFVPEVIDKRIKLMFHLPINPLASLYIIVSYGIICLLTISLGSLLILVLALQPIMANDFILPMVQTICPWIMGGATAYFLLAMIAVEPRWKYRICLLIMSCLLLRMFFESYSIGNVIMLYPVLIVITILSATGIIFTSSRFIKGEL